MEFKSFRIGGVAVDPPVLLAPMAGYTDAALRSVCRECGSGASLTEVVTAEGLWRGSRPSLHMLETLPGERPVGAHIYGREPDSMALAAATILKLGRFDFIDVNCGCPVRKIVAKGAGVALMKEPERIGRIVKAIREAVPLPVTVKTRLGLSPDRQNVSDVAQAVEEAGGAAIFIHARYASSRHDGPADLNVLARVKRERGIPVIGNGGVEIDADALRMFAETGVDGVMIGRGAIGNPWIFEDVARLARGEPARRHTLDEHRATIGKHLGRLIELVEKEHRGGRRRGLAEQSAVCAFRGHLFKYLCGFQGWGKVRRRLCDIRSRQDVEEAVDGVLELEREWGRATGSEDPELVPLRRRAQARRPNGSESAASGKEGA